MPKMDGQTFIKRVRSSELSKTIPIFVMSGYFDEVKPELALFDGVYFVEKPFDMKELLSSVKQQLYPDVSQEATGKAKKMILGSGEFLMREGESGNSMFWVINGELEVYREVDGKRVDLGLIKQHELVGEMSFLDNKPRSATVVATKECELLVIPNGKFTEVMNEQPRWFKGLIRILSERLRATNMKVEV